MEARWLAMRDASEKKLAEISEKLESLVPIAGSVGDVGSKVLKDVVQDLHRVRSEMELMMVSVRNRKNNEKVESDFEGLQEVPLDDENVPLAGDASKDVSGKTPGFFKDTVSRIRNRLDDMYRSDPEANNLNSIPDVDEMARLINSGKNDEALKLIIKNSKDIEDVLNLSAAALDRAGGVSGRVKDEIRRVDYVSMCAKFATTTNKRNNNITYLVDHVLYEGLLDGKIYPSDFSDKYEPLEELVTAINEDEDTTNENARRFLDLFTKTLLPATSVILKIAAVVALIASGVTPLTAGLMCASAIALDTMIQVLKSRFMCDVLMTFMTTAESGCALNEALSNGYVKKVSNMLLHETITGSIKVCHALTKGNFCK